MNRKNFSYETEKNMASNRKIKRTMDGTIERARETKKKSENERAKEY